MNLNNSSENKAWYAVYTRSRAEKKVEIINGPLLGLTGELKNVGRTNPGSEATRKLCKNHSIYLILYIYVHARYYYFLQNPCQTTY